MWSRFMCLGVRVQAAYVLQAHSHIMWERGKSLKLNVAERIFKLSLSWCERRSLQRWGGSKRGRAVFRKLMVYSITLNTVQKDDSLRPIYTKTFAGLSDRLGDGIQLFRWKGQRKWKMYVDSSLSRGSTSRLSWDLWVTRPFLSGAYIRGTKPERSPYSKIPFFRHPPTCMHKVAHRFIKLYYDHNVVWARPFIS